MIVKGKYPDYLMHYGVSINDGAPGVGTGNWRRGGVRIEGRRDPEGGFRNVYISRDGTEHDTSIGAHTTNAYNSAKKMLGAVKSKIIRKKDAWGDKKINKLASNAAKEKKLVEAYERYKHYDMSLNPYIAEYMESDRAVNDAKEWIKNLKDPNATDPEDLEWNENNPTVVKDVLGNEWKELFWDYEAPRNKQVKEISDKMTEAHNEVRDIEKKLTAGVFEFLDSKGFDPRYFPMFIETELYKDYVNKHGTPEHWTSYLKNK